MVQPPVSVARAVSVARDVRLRRCTSRLQLSWHSVVQSVEPGCTSHFSVHCVSQLAEHSAEQSSPLQLAMHPAWQSVEQCSLQVKVAGLVVHSVLHLVWQVSVQVVVAVAVHIVEHVVVKLDRGALRGARRRPSRSDRCWGRRS